MVSRNKQLRGIRPNVKYRPATLNTGGVRQNRAERFMTMSDATIIKNMHSESEGSWTAHNIGYTNKNATVYESGASLQGLHWYIEPDGTEHLLAAANGKLLSINASTYAATVLAASPGIGTATKVDFTTFRGLTFYCDGTVSAPRTYDGTTETGSGGWPVDTVYNTPKYVEIHNGRLAYANMNGYASTVIFSDIDDGESFTTGGAAAGDYAAVEVGPGDGQRITGIKSVYVPQTNDTYLLVAKERSLYAITGRSAVSADADAFAVVLVNSGYGCVDGGAMVQIGNDVIMLGELPGGGFGFVSYTTAMQNGTLQPTFMGSDMVRDTLRSLNRGATGACYGFHVPSRREVLFGIPTGSSTTVNQWVVYKYPANQDETAKWSIRTDVMHTCGLVFQDRILAGTTNGYISQWFTNPTYNGTPIQWEYEFPYTDLGSEGQFKRITTSFAHFRASIDADVTFKAIWLNGGNNNQAAVSQPLSAQASAAIYGTAVYGVDRYGQAVERKLPFKTFGNGERLKYNIKGQTTANGGPEFLGLTLFVEYGGPSHHYR